MQDSGDLAVWSSGDDTSSQHLVIQIEQCKGAPLVVHTRFGRVPRFLIGWVPRVFQARVDEPFISRRTLERLAHRIREMQPVSCEIRFEGDQKGIVLFDRETWDDAD